MKTITQLMKSKTSKSILSYLFLFGLGFVSVAYGQNKYADINTEVKSGTDAIIGIVKMIINAAFFLGAIWVVWSLVSGAQDSKNKVIGYLAALVVWFAISAIIGKMI